MTDTRPEWEFAGHHACREEIERLRAERDEMLQIILSTNEERQRLEAALAQDFHAEL